jgi:hypothetical protein
VTELLEKIVVGLRICLLVILCLSLFQLWSVYQTQEEVSSYSLDLVELKEKLQQPIEVEPNELDFKLQLGKDNWQESIKTSLFNVKEEPKVDKDPPEEEAAQEPEPKQETDRGPDTNLPQFLLNSNDNLAFSLLAISKQGGNSKALIRDKSNGKTYIVGQGDKFKECEVQEITESEVVLSYQDQELNLKFSN